ncbi:MAG TPA: sodium:proton antiporter [Planosporangium sp.]|jgi:CPA1 family monovalent cation:H+ antiporter|nr:sodium:proton antiporter [Planosporangium sp.]
MYGAQLLLVIIGAIAVTAFAQRRGLQAPLFVVALASMVSFVPGMPRLDLPPEFILGVVLPPLLYSTALDFSFVSFTRNLWSIVTLGVGLVVFSAVATAVFASWVVPGLPLAAGLVLGAVLAPSDAVAAVAVGRRLCLPKRLVSILTGESLVNDAAALTLFTLTSAAVVGIRTRPHNPVLFFLYSAVVGTGVGLLVALVVHWVRVRLCDPGLETVLGMVVPFAAYLVAEQVHASGVLAVVAAGFFLGHHAANAGFETRLQSRQVWRSLDVLLEAFIFAYMGLQLRFVIEDVAARGVPLRVFVVTSVLVLLAVLLTRPVWIFLMFGPALRQMKALTVRSTLARRIEDRLRAWGGHGRPPLRQSEELPWKYSAVMSWTGMRGVVTLAAAAGVPITTLRGDPFPGRGFIQASAFVVAVGTLLIQGFTLPPLIRALDIADSGEWQHERDETRRAQSIARHAARQATAEMVAHSPHGVDRTVLYSIEQRVEQYLVAYQALHEPTAEAGPGPQAQRPPVVRDLIQHILAQQRRALVRERDAGRLDDEVLRTLLEQLDYEEAAASYDVPNRL